MKCRVLLATFLVSNLVLTSQPCMAEGSDRSETGAGGLLPADLTEANRLWELRLGTHQYSRPTIDRGRIFLGINDVGLEHPVVKGTGGSVVACLDEPTGRMVWRLPIPRFRKELHRPHFFNQWRCGLCSSPVVHAERLYVVGSRGDVLCLDRNGMANGNDGPFVDEARYMGVPEDAPVKLRSDDGDIIWRYDMLSELAVYPHDACGSTVLIHDGLLYACTSNGTDASHEKMTNELAPSLIVLDATTGRLVAKDDEKIGRRVFHGQWSSPALGIVDGRPIVFYGGGDGILYAFEPPKHSAEGGQVAVLKKLWSHDCNPPEYRFKDGKPLRYCGWKNRYPGGPSDIIATPVFHNDRVYVAIGQSPIHGPGSGMLSCLDAADGNEIWSSKLVDRSLSTVAIADGLLYISDFSGNLHCFDADTGQRCWVQDLGSPVWCASPIVADGKVYVGTENRGFWILRAGRRKELLHTTTVDSMAITAVVANRVLYIPTQRNLCTYRTGAASPASD
jgi:outer membrane protein assembly factor BamB